MVKYNSFLRFKCFAKQNVRRAFTLLEVIIAIALTAILCSLTAATVVNVARIYEQGDVGSNMDRHLAGLDRFLNAILEEQLSIRQGGSNSNYCGVQYTTLPNENNKYYPQFTINLPYPILKTWEIPQPELTAWLYWDDLGLWMYTRSKRQEESWIFLSSYFEKAEYFIEESDGGTTGKMNNSWSVASELNTEDLTGKSIRLRLIFKDKTVEHRRVLELPLTQFTPGGMIY